MIKATYQQIREINRACRRLRQITVGLKAVAMTLAVVLAAYFFYAGPQANERRYTRLTDLAARPQKNNSDILAENYSTKFTYTKLFTRIAQRNVFTSLVPVVEAAEAEDQGKDILQRFRLVGVMLGRAPQAIIEDKSAAQTFFVSPGDEIVGMRGARVNAIREDRVVLSYAGNEMELIK